MGKNVSAKLGQGISPQQFIDGMTKNQEQFRSIYESFEWPNGDDRTFFESLNGRDDLRCLIIAADWCGDVVRNVPVVFHALAASGMPTEVLIMEQHLETMDEFLTMGGRSIPVVIFADQQGVVRGQWGPRTKHVQEPMIAFKLANPDREAADYQQNLSEARTEIMRRYGEGEGISYQSDIIIELRQLLSTL
ncbi:thioredoxin [Paenibacillus sp. CCS19]|uniref:thioredoxin family protein n=1 Tax=Paenibacillus sp. CCS19 TaxID=3158387 RepID=UPI00256CB05C|nr:thioredoxin family protein [Paenibacillus cellulosilyticus]GMK42079.1 thioredoxin [Paenibacillus cellulosilyticus]